MLAHWLSKVKKLNVHNVVYFSTCKRPSMINVGINEKTGVATVTMQNLPVNTLNLEFMQQMNTTIDDLVVSKTRAIIFQSGIPKIFCAGLDLKEMYQPEVSRLNKYFGTVLDFFQKMYGCGLPTAVVINGHALAAACVIAVACQYRVMVKGKSLIGLNEAELGLKVTSGVVDMIKQTISPKQTMFALTTAKMFTVEEALKIGLIDDISGDQQDGLNRAEQFMKRFDKIDKSVGMDIRRTIQSAVLKQMQDSKEDDIQQLTAFIMDDRTQKKLSAYMLALKNEKKNDLKIILS